MPAPHQYVEAPAFTPLPFGLLGALGDVIRNPSNPHWQGGVRWEPICAEGGTTYDECWSVSGTGGVAPPPPPSKVATTTIGRKGAMPFTVLARIDCSAVGFWDDAEARANASFTQSEQWQAERAFWTGIAGGQPVVWPHLAANTQIVTQGGTTILQTAATVVTGGGAGPLDIVEGLGILEKQLADCYDGVGVIHASRILLPAMLANLLVYQDGPRYRTGGGNIVVFGGGYTGSAPDGTSVNGQSWMYATGAMFVYRSAPKFIGGVEGFNRDENTLSALVERNYLIGWDCCHLAVNISTGGVVTGTVGSA